MRSWIGNSFYHQNLENLKVLAIVPHEDDEINTCAALLKALSECGADLTLVYTTNGDWKYDALTRMKEASEAAGVLGVRKEQILFLGYGDSINNDKHDHIFYTKDKPAVSAAGHSETYGTGLYEDYAFKVNGKHHIYTKENYLSDIISVLEEVRADLIICTDFDEHPDHRMLALLLDQAIGVIRSRDPEYRPELWKRFAYPLAYTAVPDYSCINNPQTQRPIAGVNKKYKWDIIDKSIYSWNDRIRIPVPFTEGERLESNLITEALDKHKSQRIIVFADRIINSDEVFWRRRTDSISYAASVRASSGNANFLNDFMLYNTEDIDDPVPPFVDYYWKPEAGDSVRTAVFTWNEPQQIEQIILYPSISSNQQKLDAKITLSDGYTVCCNDIPCNGSPYIIQTGRHDGITACEVKLPDSGLEEDCGLSECEIYSSARDISCIGPFCKITAEDNFVYEYIVSQGTDKIPLGVYSFGCKDETWEFKVTEGRSRMDGSDLILDPSDRVVAVQCSGRESGVWDRIVVKIVTQEDMALKLKCAEADRKYLEKERKSLKVHNMIYILKKNGPAAVVRRTFKNVILPRLRKKRLWKRTK